MKTMTIKKFHIVSLAILISAWAVAVLFLTKIPSADSAAGSFGYLCTAILSLALGGAAIVLIGMKSIAPEEETPDDPKLRIVK